MRENVLSGKSERIIQSFLIIVVADSLHSKQPMIETIKNEQMHFVLTAKEENYKALMEYVQGARILVRYPVSR